jgi:hypothetical protein
MVVISTQSLVVGDHSGDGSYLKTTHQYQLSVGLTAITAILLTQVLNFFHWFVLKSRISPNNMIEP